MAAGSLDALILGASAQVACVVDARLALARLGLLSVVRLTRGFAVWVPRELRGVLLDVRRHLDNPQSLVPRAYCASLRNLEPRAQADEVGAELAQWDRLPEDDELAALPLFHVGERADESFTPRDIDSGVRARFEQLQRGLDRVLRQSGYDLPRGLLVASCFRDAAALCAALQPYRAFVLTRLEADGEGAPALCNYLDAWGLAVHEAPQGGGLPGQELLGSLARVGVTPLIWAGLQLAAVHIVLPGYPVLGGADKGLDPDAVSRLWSQASVVWHRV